jgi:hypothetical protein
MNKEKLVTYTLILKEVLQTINISLNSKEELLTVFNLFNQFFSIGTVLISTGTMI